MTLQTLHSEFPYTVCDEFGFLFYRCTVELGCGWPVTKLLIRHGRFRILTRPNFHLVMDRAHDPTISY
jgi:hypothetical protein